MIGLNSKLSQNCLLKRIRFEDIVQIDEMLKFMGGFEEDGL